MPSTPQTVDLPANLPTNTSNEPRKLKITRKVKDAIDAMVWKGLKRDEAAQFAGIKDNSLYVALRRPDVKAYYLAECEVLRTSGRARRIARLEELSEQNENKAAAVQAIRALDNMEDEQATRPTNGRVAGMVFVIQTNVSASPQIEQQRQIELNPLMQNGVVTNVDS